MPAPLVYVDHSEVKPGKQAQLFAAVRELAEFVEAREPRAISYQVYFDAERTWMTVLQIHPDEASLITHLDVAGPRFAPFRDFVRLRRMEIYGTVGPDLVARLREKLRLLGGNLELYNLEAGFARLDGGSTHRPQRS